MPARRKGSDLGPSNDQKYIHARERRAQRRDLQIQPNNENVRVNMVRLREAQAEQNQKRRLVAQAIRS